MLLPSLAIAGVLSALTASGVLASSISVSGTPFAVTADRLDGTGFAQYGGIVSPAGKGPTPVAVTVIEHARLTNLCQSFSVGPVSLRLTAGGGGTPVSVTGMVVDADRLSGDAVVRNIVIGQDAGTLSVPPAVDPQPQPGGFGESATSVTIRHVNQHTWLTTAGTFKLPGLHVGFGRPCAG